MRSQSLAKSSSANKQSLARNLELDQENQQSRRQQKQNELISSDDRQKQISLLRAQLSSREAELAQRELKITELKQNLKSSNETMKTILPKIQKQQNIIKQQKDTISLLKSENQSLKAENTSFRTRRESSAASSSTANSELLQRLSAFKEALAKRNNECKALNSKIENLQNQNKQLIEIIQLQDSKIRQKSIISTNRSKSTSSASSSIILQATAKDISLNEAVLGFIESQARDKVLQENVYLKAKNDAISTQAQQIADLQKELNDKNSEIEEYRKKISSYDELEEELQRVKAETEQLKQSLKMIANLRNSQ